MATCPRCLGPLSDDHRCPPSISVLLWIRDVLFAAIVGGSFGFLVFELLGRLTGAESVSILGGAVGFMAGLVAIRWWNPGAGPNP